MVLRALLNGRCTRTRGVVSLQPKSTLVTVVKVRAIILSNFYSQAHHLPILSLWCTGTDPHYRFQLGSILSQMLRQLIPQMLILSMVPRTIRFMLRQLMGMEPSFRLLPTWRFLPFRLVLAQRPPEMCAEPP
jgi:hypothetical protein